MSKNPQVKELLKSVHICESYHKNKSGIFFLAHAVEFKMKKVVVKILQGSVVIQTTLGGLTIHPPVANFL